MLMRCFSAALAAALRSSFPLKKSGIELEFGSRQFVIADPDGFLLRFFTDIGSRAIE